MGVNKFIHITVVKEAAKEFTNLRNVTFQDDQPSKYRMRMVLFVAKQFVSIELNRKNVLQNSPTFGILKTFGMHLKTNYTGGYRTNENDTTKEWGKMSV